MKKINMYESPKVCYPIGNYITEAKEYISDVIKTLRAKKLIKPKQEIHLWVRGSSGAILGALFCSKVNNPVVINHVKKSGENSHSGSGDFPPSDAINFILDDFACSGETIQAIYEEIQIREKYNNKKLKITALVLDSYTSNTDFRGIKANYLLSNTGSNKNISITKK